MATKPSEQPAHPRNKVVGNVIRGCVGNLVEWYDWFVYAAFSVFFAPAFFPSEDPTAQLLSTAVVFAVGFLMRPLGGYILGRYADKYGRKNALTLSVCMMAAGSLLIAVAPSYAAIGIAAPVILVVARLIQGLSVGGEFGSSSAYLSEVATPARRGFFSSFQYVSIILGQLTALFIQIVLLQVLTREQMMDWGWRVPFVIGAIAAIVVMFIRRGMEESEQYIEEKERAAASGTKPEGSLRTLFKYPKQLALVFGLTIGGTIAFYTFTTYLQKYMINTSGIDAKTVAWINFIALFCYMCMQPLVGALSDKIGRRKVMIAFGVGGAFLTVPILTALGATTNPITAFLLMMCGLTIVTFYSALSAIVKAEMFPTKVRALGVGLPHALTAAVFGGTAEPIALGLKQAGFESAYFYYVSACAALTLVAALIMKETRGSSTLDPNGIVPETPASTVQDGADNDGRAVAGSVSSPKS
ncbi:MFS transporter [Rhodococcus sp. B10]|uniref:MFS transporter n=1 Tax=Rhodococcus sp. B10 TaxID=2695876 RepID=UPI00142FC781|nr:MFS transporter [Rhodococcus sp. B10]NIL77887.1 Alpha-ketoglutarate permease [Rhodococcus sp. B10]